MWSRGLVGGEGSTSLPRLSPPNGQDRRQSNSQDSVGGLACLETALVEGPPWVGSTGILEPGRSTSTRESREVMGSIPRTGEKY